MTFPNAYPEFLPIAQRAGATVVYLSSIYRGLEKEESDGILAA